MFRSLLITLKGVQEIQMEATFSKQEVEKSTESSQVSFAGNEEVIHSLRTEIDDKQQKIRRPCLVSEMSGSHYRKLLADKTGGSANIEKETDEKKDGFLVSRNVPQNSILGQEIEFPQTSQNKRPKLDKLGETTSCKRCNCKKSKCLKLYCECFANGLYCVEPCNCHECFNKPIHEDIVIENRCQIKSRNPLSFAHKAIKSFGTPNSMDELGKTQASIGHKKGCNCKKSGCVKKYCVCFQGGVGCSLNCQCEGCKNTFGCKEGSENIAYHETKFLQRNPSDVSSLETLPGTKENHDQVTPDLSMNARIPRELSFMIRPADSKLGLGPLT